MKRRIEITIERESVRFLRRESAAQGWCNACDRWVWMLTPEEAARRARSSVRAICRQVESGQTHFTETADGALLICSVSIRGMD